MKQQRAEELAALVKQGKTNDEIAAILGLSRNTVTCQISRLKSSDRLPTTSRPSRPYVCRLCHGTGHNARTCPRSP